MNTNKSAQYMIVFVNHMTGKEFDQLDTPLATEAEANEAWRGFRRLDGNNHRGSYEIRTR